MSDSKSIIFTNNVNISEIIMYAAVFILFGSAILFITHPRLPDIWGLTIFDLTLTITVLSLIVYTVIAVPLLYFNLNKEKYWIYEYWISHYDPKLPFSTRKSLLIDSYKCKFKSKPNKKILLDLEGFDKYLERIKRHLTSNQYSIDDILNNYNISCDHSKQKGLSLNFLQDSHWLIQFLPNKLIEINSIIDLNDPIKQFEDGFFEAFKVSTLTRLTCGSGFIIINAFIIFGTLGTYYGYFDSTIQTLEVGTLLFILLLGLLYILVFAGLIFLMTVTALSWYHGRSLKERKQYLQYSFLGHINHSSYSPTILVLSLVAYMYLTLIAGIKGYKTEFYISRWVGLKNSINPNKKRRGRPKGSYDADPYYTLIWHNELAKKKEFQHNSSGDPYYKKIKKEIINRYQRKFGITLTAETINNYYKIVGLKNSN